MKGLELARQYYQMCGVPMLKSRFGAYTGRIAAGLVGEGSECFGFDDELSRDHDWGPGFCLWLAEDDLQSIGQDLQQAYLALASEFLGYRRQETPEGGGRVGVQSIGGFYRRFIGISQAPSTLQQWRAIPESYLATATNGEVFADEAGDFSAIRARLLAYYPEDVRIKKIVARAAIMAQAGQYNYPRCLARGELVAAAMALGEFMDSAISMVYLLNKRYKPFYKWMHRGIMALPILRQSYDLLSRLCDSCGADPVQNQEAIELLCNLVICELQRQGLTDMDNTFLIEHCPAMSNHIQDKELRSLHIMQE